MYLTVGGREHDIENIQLAQELAKEIADWVRETPNWTRYVSFNTNIDGWVLDLQRIGNRSLDGLYLILTRKDNPRYLDSGFGFAGEHPVILLKMLDSRGITNPHLGNWLAVGYEDQLFHELVHYLDWKRTGVRGEDVGPHATEAIEAEDWEAYANHPFEINARFQEAANTMVRLATHPNERVKLKAQETFLSDYPRFRAAVWGQMWPEYVEALTSENLQRLEKRTYQLWDNLRENS